MRSKTERPTGPMMMVMTFVVALAAASCGGDSVAADEDWREILMADGYSAAQADCIIDDLAEIGLTPAEVDAAANSDDENVPLEAVDVLFACTIMRDAASVLDTGDGDADLSAVPSDFARYADDTTTGAYGDDPVFDALWDECEAGDARSCDDLYLDSPFGSTYELFGVTCGGRFDPGATFSCVSEAG